MDGLLNQNPALLSALGINPEDLRRQQQQAGLLSAGLQLLAGSGYSPVRQSTGQLLGQAGMAGVQGMQQAGESAIDRALKGLQAQELIRKQQEAQSIRTLAPQLYRTEQAALPPTDEPGGYIPGAIQPQTRQALNQSVVNQLMSTPAGMEYLTNRVKAQRELAGKTEIVEIYGPSGQPIKVRYNIDTNEYTPLGGEKAEPLTQIDLGDRVELRTPSGKLVGRIDKGLAPTAPAFQFNENTGLVFNPRAGTVSQPTDPRGNPVDVSNFRKPSEGENKQIIGVQNTRNAITEFRAELNNFSRLDSLKPKDRARIETKYRNMLMQAKEAYNLGVLNGPDLAILEQIIYNPTTVKGMVIGKEGIDAQAAELDRIMANIKTTVQTRGAPLPTPAQPAAPTPKQNEVPVPSAPPAGVSQELWNVMTPEEKKLWRK
jgi:hypothetical protein